MRPDLVIMVTGEPPPSVAASHGGYDAMVLRTIEGAWQGTSDVVDVRHALPARDDGAAVSVFAAMACDRRGPATPPGP